ncbi:hypothetical protein [Cupriavidus malaysiensis]|uniref:hypothetical protein n=1 Tax=Cupriavidus malaysiensis TaxID=367825 RepID=UPI0012FF6A81|nr:hypothetical protein [Cupriavidus malaysiensis]
MPCRVAKLERPAWALDLVDPTADVYTKGRAALVELEQRKAFEEKQAAAIAACQ